MKKLIIILAAFLLVLAASQAWAENPDCTMCHPEKTQGKSVHPAVQMGCTVCHTGVDANDIPHKFSSGFEKGLMAEPPDLCFNCHDKGMFSGKKDVHPPVAAGMCTTCHNPHSSENDHLLQGDNVCLNCHDSAMFTKSDVHPPVAAGMCTSCHNPHQSDNAKLLKTEVPELCWDCHKKEDFFGPTVHAPVGVGLCTICHSPHSSDNKKLLVKKTPDLCFICHVKSSFFLKSVHKPVSEGQCTQCHAPHASQNESLLVRKGNFLCRKCHADVERQPHAIIGFSRVGHPLRGRRDPIREGKTFGCLSCHLPHTSESPRLFRYKAQGMFDLCGYCHKM